MRFADRTPVRKTAFVRRDASDDPREQVWGWIALIAATLVTSAIAFLLTGARCGALTVTVNSSTYCRALNAPGVASTTLGIGLQFMLFALPTIVALAAGVRWVLRRRGSLTRVSAYCAAAVLLSLLLLAAAHAQYAPLD